MRATFILALLVSAVTHEIECQEGGNAAPGAAAAAAVSRTAVLIRWAALGQAKMVRIRAQSQMVHADVVVIAGPFAHCSLQVPPPAPIHLVLQAIAACCLTISASAAEMPLGE